MSRFDYYWLANMPFLAAMSMEDGNPTWWTVVAAIYLIVMQLVMFKDRKKGMTNV